MAAVNPNRFGTRDAQPLFGGDAKDVLEGLFGKSDPKDMPVQARAQIEATARIRAIAARKFGDAEGEELLEALCDASVRRPNVMPATAARADQLLAYAYQREGQNQMLFMLLGWIAEGRAEQPPQREGNHAPASRKRTVKPARKSGRKRK